MSTINFGFGCTALTFCFKFGHILGLFCTFFGPFGLFFGLFGLFLELGSGSKTFLEHTYVVNQLCFWKYSPIFLLLLRPNLGPFLPFLGLWWLFLGSRSGSKTFLGPAYKD